MSFKDLVFFDGDKEAQRELMNETIRLWQSNGAIIDTLQASVRFKLIPRQTVQVVNYTLAHFRYKSYVIPTMKKFEVHFIVTFIDRITQDTDMWYMAPLAQGGFDVLLHFTGVFGGRTYYPEQFVMGMPFSLYGLLKKVATKEYAVKFIHGLMTTKPLHIVVPTEKDFKKRYLRRRSYK